MTKESGRPLLEFPCEFPIKVFGSGSEDFAQRVAAIVRRHAPDLPDTAVASRSSKGGRYLAVTVNLHARSQEQLDAIYRELSSSPDIVMVL
ncbi:HP0495 family protein [Methyloterricola oryzae]|uniref:HP0495 family protein n=1 Tax=Methyloterricola oryzae TaxID=1495050 RepID=UPI0005EAD9E7|nr:DUF493 domain-containing protein [Methyloterricola oryzae]